MTKRMPVVAANWKMNGSRELVNQVLLQIKQSGVCQDIEVVISPPATLYSYFDEQKKIHELDHVFLAAQNINELDNGALTGEISVGLAKESGCQWVICGHSERRSLFKETSKVTAKKFMKALNAGLKPILCVGETTEEKETGKTFSRLTAQIEAVMHLGGKQAFKDCLIAYEPIWAVGTGQAASPELAQEIHRFIRGMIASICPETAKTVRILYGGSIKPENAAALFSQPDIDGGLIGGAGLVPEQFIKICQLA
ncbi:triose-phosphate isomerase [Catenovulum sp. 2E275]|uniref:triose-phosphate isomerase n=1 Tax=Catenovulum sp. 2E275 TaxID=2980497 RepID=UPI0021D2B37F|nr:triose-phosphate isomerase [Catenovulum sp. 2E275]MCU4676750.1 triose-phosphate isomerase [Catenovulum sp. 2E275]